MTADRSAARIPPLSPGVSGRAWVVTTTSAVLGLILVALLGRVVHLQTRAADQIAARADRQHHATRPLPARRGGIFDRHGVMLAGSVATQDVFVDPRLLLDTLARGDRPLAMLDRTAGDLARLLGLDPFETYRRIVARPDARYVRLARSVDVDAVAAVRALGLRAVGFEASAERVYPAGDLAAHLLGGVGADGMGLEGVERRQNALLSGSPGRVRTRTDAAGRPLRVDEGDYVPPIHGRHLVLTIDARLQHVVQQELAQTVRQYRALSGDVVLLDPHTGDVLAMATYPSHDPADPAGTPPGVRRFGAIVDPFEPGSVLKPFIVADGLGRGAASLAEVFDIAGPLWRTPYGRRIVDVSSYERLNLWDVLVKSSNIGMARLVARSSTADLRDGLTRLGFGVPTGLDLPGEGAGRVSPVERWTRYSADSVAQGYELLVTPLQMAAATAVLANGGVGVTPRVVLGELGPDGGLIRSAPNATAARVLPENVAGDVLRVLADVPVRGTGKRARLDRWAVFGKTGTAHAAVQGRYDDRHYTAGFVGGAPYESPRLVLCAVIRHPDKSVGHYGGEVAAPLAGRILERSLTLLNVPPSPSLPPIPGRIAEGLLDYSPPEVADPDAPDAAETSSVVEIPSTSGRL